MFVQTKRFTIAEYHRLDEIGLLQKENHEDRTELIRGEILFMAAKGTKHTVCCSNVNRALNKLVGDRAIIRCQDPILLPPDSQPEPDFVIVRDRPDNYLDGHPLPEDILLVIEIADSSLIYDRDIKGAMYAEAGINDYWLFNLNDNRLEAYSEPYCDAQGEGNYTQRRYIFSHQVISIPTFPDLQMELSKILSNISSNFT
jgi:Uma2 family endonuclease